jgi:hypothetical protein
MDVFGRFCNGPTEIHRLLQSLIISYLVFNKIGVLYYPPYCCNLTYWKTDHFFIEIEKIHVVYTEQFK